MNMFMRIILAIALVVLDLLIFFVPLAALFLAYILLFNPPWFRGFLNGMSER
jgi:hypothetical protein